MASDCGKVILSFVALRRPDCLLERTKPAILAQLKKLPASADRTMREMLPNRAAAISRIRETTIKMIDRLHERRSALITPTVTGQIDVWSAVGIEAAA